MSGEMQPARYDAVVFDLLTALIDSWSLWNDVAGSPEQGLAWRAEYLRLTYGAGAYRPYELIVADAAANAGLGPECAANLAARWGELQAWPEASGILADLATRSKLGVITNCSRERGHAAATSVFPRFDVVLTAEEVGCYKPCRAAYARTLESLGTEPERTLFVAGSPSDVPGASALGMPVYWHNRIGMPAANNANPAFHERSLSRLVQIV